MVTLWIYVFFTWIAYSSCAFESEETIKEEKAKGVIKRFKEANIKVWDYNWILILLIGVTELLYELSNK